MTETTAELGTTPLSCLWRLAHHCGVMPAYIGADGQRVRASADALLAALRMLGEEVNSVDDAPNALRRKLAEERRHALEPVTVIWEGEASTIAVHAPDEIVECRLTLEDGSVHEWRASGHAVSLPIDPPIGYHAMEVEINGRSHHTHIFRAPRRCHAVQGRRWGVFAPLYAIRSKRNWGAGDLTDLRELVAWVQSHGGAMVGTLPLLATWFHDDEEPSPYRPLSKLFWNEFYIDVERAPEFARNDAARSLVASREFRAALRKAKAGDLIDYQRVMAIKRRILEHLAPGRRTPSPPPGDAPAHELRRYARFRAVAERENTLWPDWPARQRGGDIREGDYDLHVEQYHLYVQHVMQEQLSALGADNRRPASISPLYLDLPVGVHPGGYDTWAHRDIFLNGADAGAPPDGFFTGGQNWALAPLHPQRTREDGHAYFRDTLRHHLQFAGSLRIDHVMMLHRLYCIPHGLEATDGVYVRYPAEELWAALCIESHRAKTVIIGENLGTVPPSVNRAMDRHGVRPLYVGLFSFTGDSSQPLRPPRNGAVASLNTHDTATFTAHWSGRDITERHKRGLLDDDGVASEREERTSFRRSLRSFLRTRGITPRTGQTPRQVMLALLDVLGESDAEVVLVALEDLWLETQPQNRPGMSHRHNWRRRMRYSLERIRTLPQARTALRRMAEARAAANHGGHE